MTELFTSHWRSPLLKDVDATIVSISRGQPRWSLPFKYRKLPACAPDDRTWAQEDWDDFTTSYRRQLEEIGVDAVLAKLERISQQAGGVAVVLLCYEVEEVDCHRGLLSAFLRERGVEIRELVPGDLPQREDAAELRLF